MGYLPGFATPRSSATCRSSEALDPPARRYDRERGISYWTKNYRTGIEAEDPTP